MDTNPFRELIEQAKAMSELLDRNGAEALRLADQLSAAVVDNYETGDWVSLLDKALSYRKARGLE